MLSTWIQSKKDEEGFTLIELLVVVIIIGILAAIAIPTFLSQRERGWQAAIVSDTRNSALEVEADYTANNGQQYLDDQAAFNAMFTVSPITNPANATLVYTTNADQSAFCLTGNDDRLDNGPFVYDSTLNGMQDPGVACSF